MPKGKMTGSPTNIVCWLVGGYFNDTVLGIAYDSDNLLSEIDMLYYLNPRAERMKVKILGITRQAPDDKLVVERYELVYSQEKPPAFAIYVCNTSSEWDGYIKNLTECVEKFMWDKGYLLDESHLDPTKMPGEPRTISLEQE